MTQIINIITFLKELFFPMDRSETKRGKHALRSFFITAALIASLGLNYYAVRGIYQVTYQSIQLKDEIRTLKPMAEKVKELERTNEILSITLATLAPERFATSAVGKAHQPGRVPVKGKPPVTTPPLPPRPTSKDPVIEGKTIAVGN